MIPGKYQIKETLNEVLQSLNNFAMFSFKLNEFLFSKH